MKLTPEQKAWLDSLICQRLSADDNNDNYRLNFENDEDSIANFIADPKTFENDKNGNIAVYVIREKEQIVAYFTLQCGMIFEKVISEEDKRFFELYQKVKDDTIADDERKELLIYQASHNFSQKELDNEAHKIEQKIIDVRPKKKDDAKNEPERDVKIVHSTHPSIEIVHFGKNSNYEGSFNELFPNERMGEVLFMNKIVPTIRNVIDVVGAKFVYLFAVTNERDNKLVAHYNSKFGFKSNPGYGVNKSLNASGCQFMAQSLTDLFELAANYSTINKKNSD